ncbi:MAG TPA: cytochrome c biogenesis protein ResB [Smithellaceae bacterium]|nr:cytochrome c biogenesis protein ResB [Smithellaceae bacterium]
MSKNKSGIWSFFASVQLAVVLLSLIAFFALIGTLVPQREAAVEFGEKLSPALLTFLQKMQVFDLYHSVWFILLSGLLAVNLLICSLDRFPMAWRRFRMRHEPRNDEAFKDPPEGNAFQTAADIQKAAAAASALLQKKYRNVERTDEADGIFLCAQKGRFSLFGVYIVHLSILLLIAGAVVGAFFGIEAYVNIAEGEAVSSVHLRGNDQALALPFSVRCDKFTVEFYESGMPKTYQSDLSFIKDNRVIHSGKLRVNHPITFEGYNFYQSSYDKAAGGKATIALVREGGHRDVMNVAKGYDFDLPGGEGTFHVLRVEADLMKMGPAIKVAVDSKGIQTSFWVFQQIDKIRAANPDMIAQMPILNPGSFRPYTFVLMGMEDKYLTGLQMNRDPGAPIVAFAAVLLIGGLMLILFSYTRTVFIRIAQKDGGASVAVAGKSYKNSAGLQKEVQYLIAELQDNLEKPK